MHLERFGDPDSKNAIFAIFDDTDQRTLGFLHGMMVYQTVRVLCHKALEKYNGKLPRPVNFTSMSTVHCRFPPTSPASSRC